MGDRYEFSKKCPSCGHSIKCYFADSSGTKIVLCSTCKTRFEAVLDFKLIKKVSKEKGDENGRLEVTEDWIKDKAVGLFVILNILKPSQNDVDNVKTFIRTLYSEAGCLLS